MCSKNYTNDLTLKNLNKEDMSHMPKIILSTMKKTNKENHI